MDDYSVIVRRVIKFTLFFLSFSLIGYAFTQYKLQFAGLTLGASISFINTIYAARKINRLGDIAVSGENQKLNLGFATRLSTSVLAVFAALQYPQYFDLIFTVIGLFVAQTIALIDGIYLHIKSISDEKGVK